MPELSKAYEPKKFEDEIYRRWEESGFFHPDKCVELGVTADDAEHFSCVLPPPNVTGTLHMGHAAMLAIEDVIIRYHRMKGDKTLWVPGTDHAAIATQTKVEKILMEKEGMKDPKVELGRENFLERVREYAQESHDTIVNQCKKMGSSLDWKMEAYTLDETRSLAVRTVFKKMYDDDLIYRGYRLVNWCPRCHSTLADDEVEHKEENGKFYWIKYGPFVLATARPETKLGDTAVAVHPNDERYKDMVGKKYMIPGVLGEFEVQVVADEAVDPNFGTGAVKVTPAHSFVDYEIAQRHKIPMKQVIDEDGKMMANCGKYAGMTTKEAREAIVNDMQEMGLIDRIEENYVHNLGICYRCGATVEPIPSKQWFIDVNKEFHFHQSKEHPIAGLSEGEPTTLKKLMKQVVENGQIEIIPERFNRVYFNWIDNLRDWCISRQIWWGHQIPVWYKKGSQPVVHSQQSVEENIFVGVDAPTDKDWQQDPDTLDTWFSSGLWTFSALDWPNVDNYLKYYHPTNVLETGYDILFFWVARMILMTTYVLGEIPFHKVYLHGLVRDAQGRKMSKSLGNVMDPLVIIDKFGTDATRLSFLLGNTAGNDMRLSEQKVEGFRNFTNKLWNISRFMLLNIKNPNANSDCPKGKTLADKWILRRLNDVTGQATENIEKYNFSFTGELL
ncbi:valine--tRNA ligase, partial [Patescibacteria group bacterium]|nr:valine--tRNA ligase [Patescibacteria group bacterium]MBU1613537.1 valine--tRNA ligase [Patescibacteria group bacterium]